jgi:Flp pilus assembly protein TadG
MSAKHLLCENRGTALVEFAFALPVLMLLLIGGIETGRFLFFSVLVGNAAHAGASYGAQSLAAAANTSGMQGAAKADGQNISQLTIPSAGAVCSCWNGSTSTAIACSVTYCPAGAHRVVYAQVTASGTISSLLNYPGLPGSYTVSRQAMIRVQQ